MKQRPFAVGRIVQPEPLTIDIDAGFIGMNNDRLRQTLLCQCFEQRQSLIGIMIEIAQRTAA